MAVTRIRKFLMSEELQGDARLVDESKVPEGETLRHTYPCSLPYLIYSLLQALEIKNADFTWSKTALEPTLQHFDLTLRKGDLVGVLGKVGCGKTSLLSAIVGEMVRLEGSVDVRGRGAYAPQNACIMNATIRENILFSHAYDEGFYTVVLDGEFHSVFSLCEG